MIVLAEKTMEALKCKTGSQGPSSVLSLHHHSSNALHLHNTAVKHSAAVCWIKYLIFQ